MKMSAPGKTEAQLKRTFRKPIRKGKIGNVGPFHEAQGGLRNRSQL